MPKPLSTSLQSIVVDWRSRDWPIDWDAEFGRSAPLVLEIGFGNGEFLADQAAAHPHRNHVGIELSWSGAIRLFKRARGRTNVRALLIDAEVALQNLFATEQLAEVFVNHPCPWPKAKHIGRRLLNPECLALLVDRMQVGAMLTVATDHAEYAAWLAEVLTAQDELASCHPTTEVAEIPGRRPTKYQRKAMEQDIPIHFFQWKRIAPSRPPTTRSCPIEPMPSITLDGPRADGEPFQGFESQLLRERHEGVEVTVRLLGVYRRVDAGREAWLVETMVQEDRLRQDFCCFVVVRRSGEILVKLSGLGSPHPTHGVRRAVFGVARWLQERHPQLRITHENVGAEALTPIEQGADLEPVPATED